MLGIILFHVNASLTAVLGFLQSTNQLVITILQLIEKWRCKNNFRTLTCFLTTSFILLHNVV